MASCSKADTDCWMRSNSFSRLLGKLVTPMPLATAMRSMAGRSEVRTGRTVSMGHLPYR